MSGADQAAVRAEVARVRAAMVRIRRDLHAHPELAFQEVRTATLAARRCAELGYAVRTGVGGTGVLAELDSGRPGPTVLIRADMDALPVQEAGAPGRAGGVDIPSGAGRAGSAGHEGLPYRSTVDGVMHACGHDGHVAVALGVAEVLARLIAGWSGRVRMCFQPAEETDEGARQMIADGAVDGVDTAIGLHLQAGLPTGTIAIGPGVQWGSSDEIRLTLRGVGGHAGDPHRTVDPIVTAVEVVRALRQLNRYQEHDRTAVVTIAQFHAGTAPNIVPETAELAGTIRAMLPPERHRLLADVEALVRKVADAHRTSVELSFGAECPAVVCDPGVTANVRTALAAVFSAGSVVDGTPSTAADDMGRFLREVPGCYFRVGVSDPAAGEAYPHHHPNFDLDERALPVAAEALVHAALTLLTRS